MTVQELEDKVLEQDGIRIVIRDAATAKVKTYCHKNAAQLSWRITQFLQKRIVPLLNGQEVVVLDGNGEQPHGGRLLSSIRASYSPAND
ncbi:MAG: hypothetical protein WBD05_06420 [Phycisphaerae bacterium]